MPGDERKSRTRFTIGSSSVLKQHSMPPFSTSGRFSKAEISRRSELRHLWRLRKALRKNKKTIANSWKSIATVINVRDESAAERMLNTVASLNGKL